MGTRKGGVNVCQQQLVNEVLEPLVTEFVPNFGRAREALNTGSFEKQSNGRRRKKTRRRPETWPTQQAQ
jgi:hypothetical protein